MQSRSPIEDEEAKSEMAELIRSLEERRSGENYAKIKFITARLDAMGEFGGRIFLRTPEPMEQGKAYTYSHVPADLLAAMGEILGREERRQPLSAGSFQDIVRQEPYPVAGKAREVFQRLCRGITSFRLLFRGSRSRSEVPTAPLLQGADQLGHFAFGLLVLYGEQHPGFDKHQLGGHGGKLAGYLQIHPLPPLQILQILLQNKGDGDVLASDWDCST